MKVLLHVCCGVCAAGVAQTLLEEGQQVIGYFYNPNIYPEAEFHRRLDTARRVAEELGFPLDVAPYEAGQWQKLTEPFKDEPEGGNRCTICYRLRLEKTRIHLESCGADCFTTTLTISPHKSAVIVNRLGKEIGEKTFLERDFKKNDGFKKAMQLAKQWQLYRQNYCGCVYSMR